MQPAQPLARRRVVVTRAPSQARRFVELLQEAGAEVIEAPAIEIHPPSSFDSLDEVIANLDSFKRIIFTSTNGVHSFIQRLSYHNLDSGALLKLEVAVVGEATADALRESGVEPDLVPPQFTSMALLPMLEADQSAIRTAYVRAATGRDELIQALRQRGGIVELAIAYETKPSISGARRVRSLAKEGRVDAVTFTSPSTVENFFTALGSDQDSLRGVLFFSIGPTTTRALKSRGFESVVEAKEATTESLVESLIEYFATRAS